LVLGYIIFFIFKIDEEVTKVFTSFTNVFDLWSSELTKEDIFRMFTETDCFKVAQKLVDKVARGQGGKGAKNY